MSNPPDARHDLSVAEILRQAGYGYRKTPEDDGCREIFYVASGRVVGTCRAHDAITLALRDQVALNTAAPDLLEALEQMVKWYGRREGALAEGDALLPPDEQPPEVRNALAAIAKAAV